MLKKGELQVNRYLFNSRREKNIFRHSSMFPINKSYRTHPTEETMDPFEHETPITLAKDSGNDRTSSTDQEEPSLEEKVEAMVELFGEDWLERVR